MTDIVLVGDCIATGHNCLIPEITGDKDFVADGLHCGKDKSVEKKLVLWYLKTHKQQTNIESIVHHSHKAKIKKEKDISWPSHIPGCRNLAVMGETFQGMHKKIKKILAEDNKPSMVLITCFAPEHRCVVLNKNGKKYVVKRDMGVLEELQTIWPDDVYQEFVSRVKEQEPFGERYQRRKNKKSFRMLTRLLQYHDIPYKFLLFRKHNSYISDQYEDLTDLPLTYRDGNGHELFSKKLEVQPEIANRVMQFIELG